MDDSFEPPSTLTDLRRRIPILSRDGAPASHYLDNATCTLAPDFVIDAIARWHASGATVPMFSGGGRSQHRLSDRATEGLWEARCRVAALINADPAELVFAESAVAALNMIGPMLRLTTVSNVVAGEVVTNEAEHYDNLLPWTARGAKPKVVKCGPDGEPPLDAYFASLEGAQLATIGHVSHVTGCVRDVALFAKTCREARVRSLIDASQSIGRMPVDVRAIGCDFLVFSSHNLLCPPGLGVLYIREEVARELFVPFVAGGGGVNRVDAGGSFFALADRPRRFEPGPVNIGGAIGLGVAAEALRRHGMDSILARERSLRGSIVETLERIEGVRVLGDAGADSVGIVSFATTISKRLSNDHIAVILSDRFGVHVRADLLHAMPALLRLSTGEAACASVAPYTDESDVAALGRGLSLIQRSLGAL